MKKTFFVFVLIAALFMFVACGDDPSMVPVNPTDSEADTTTDTDPTDTGDTNPTDPADTEPTTPTDDGCAQTEGLSCTTDTECGACMICVTGGKCAKGCKTDDDCASHIGTKCNTKLARCTNIFASNKACDSTNCPTGCCYADKGLAGLKCEKEASPATCGLCPNGEVYSPDDSKCLPAACSSSTDNCSSINSGAAKPSCYECKTGELVCKVKTSTSGCSAGAVINAAQCIPAGQQCVEGVSECCSGMPCVQGYCY